MPAGSAAAPICDTWALIDYLVESAPDDGLFRKAIDQACTRYVPGLVLAEVDYFLRDERQAMQVFMQDLAHGAFTYAPPTIGQVSRAMEVDRRFANLRLGLVDSSVVALSESLRIRRLATRDVRHCAAVRLRDGRPFELVEQPTDPDRSRQRQDRRGALERVWPSSSAPRNRLTVSDIVRSPMS